MGARGAKELGGQLRMEPSESQRGSLQMEQDPL